MARQTLLRGDLVAIPTETVYGLAADALNDQAVQKIYDLKGRPSINPLIIHVSSLEMAMEYGLFSDAAYEIAHYFWIQNPQPLTLVVPLKGSISPLVTAGLPTIAIRYPHHLTAHTLIQRYGRPLAAPSANISNTLSPTNAERVQQHFPDLFVLDGGCCQVGLESTILETHSFQILRHGGCTQELLEDFLGKRLIENLTPDQICCPGQMRRHYAPKIPVRMNATSPLEGEAWVTFGIGDQGFSLSPDGDLKEAAAKLFQTLAFIENSSYQRIAVMAIPPIGLGVAINDRLKRASFEIFQG